MSSTDYSTGADLGAVGTLSGTVRCAGSPVCRASAKGRAMRSSTVTLVMLGTTAVAWSQALTLLNPDFARLGADGKPSDWSLSTWYASPVPAVAVSADAGGPVVSFAFPADSSAYTVSFHQTLPPLPPSATARVRFRYRAEFAGERRTSIAISGGPGCGVPCSRVWFSAVRDAQWHTADIAVSARLLKRSENVLEFTFNETFGAGDRFALAEVSVVMEPLPALRLGFTDPVSGVVFTDQVARVVRGVLQAGPAAAGRRAQVALVGAEPGSAPLATQDCGVGERRSEWAFDFAGQPPGRYRVVATLAGDDGAEVARQELTTWFLAPNADTTRVVEGRVHHGAAAIVPFGTYHVCDNAVAATNRENRRLGLPLLDREAMLAGLGRVGLTAGFFSWGIPTNEFLEAAARHGHRVIPEASGLGLEWGGKPLAEQVAPFAEDPRVWAWGGWDEPSMATLERAVQVYRGLKSVTPQKLVVSSFCEPAVVDLLEDEGVSADLLLVDIYAVRAPDSDLSAVGTAVAHVAAVARRHGGLAVGVTPQAFVYNGPEPSPAQLRVQIYLGLVNGAVVFFPYAYVEDYAEVAFAGRLGQPDGMSANPGRQRWWLPDSVLWQSLPQLSRELAQLTPLILRGQPLPATASPSPVQFMVRHVEGEGFLIAANPQASANSATFTLEPQFPALTPLFETPAATATGAALSLSFGAYEVKVFRFQVL